MPSAVVADIKYDPTSSTLRVIFVSGMIYDYKNVPEHVYRAMKEFVFEGIFLNLHVKGRYRFEKGITPGSFR